MTGPPSDGDDVLLMYEGKACPALPARGVAMRRVSSPVMSWSAVDRAGARKGIQRPTPTRCVGCASSERRARQMSQCGRLGVRPVVRVDLACGSEGRPVRDGAQQAGPTGCRVIASIDRTGAPRRASGRPSVFYRGPGLPPRRSLVANRDTRENGLLYPTYPRTGRGNCSTCDSEQPLDNARPAHPRRHI